MAVWLITVYEILAWKLALLPLVLQVHFLIFCRLTCVIEHLVFVTIEVDGPRQEGPGLWSARRVAGRQLETVADIREGIGVCVAVGEYY